MKLPEIIYNWDIGETNDLSTILVIKLESDKENLAVIATVLEMVKLNLIDKSTVVKEATIFSEVNRLKQKYESIPEIQTR